MSAELEQFSPARLPATLAAVRTLSLSAACISVVLLVLIVGLELLVPVSDTVAVRDGVGLVLTSVASWLLFAIAVRMLRAYPRPTGAFGAVMGVMIGLGAVAFVLNFVLDIVLAPRVNVIAVAVPVALVICVVIPGVYLSFAARAVQRHARAA